MKQILNALLIAGLILGAALGLNYAGAMGLPGYAEGDVTRRSMGVLMGLIVAFMSNTIPKRLTPLTDMSGDPAIGQARRRRAAWIFVLSGLGYAGVWALAPIARANLWSMALLGSGVALALAQCAFAARPR